MKRLKYYTWLLSKNTLYILLFLAITYFLGIAFNLQSTKAFDFDEYETMHSAWSIKEGQVLYKDLAYAHGPTLVSLYSALWTAQSLQDCASTLLYFRHLSYLWMIIILFITYNIGSMLFNKKTGLLSVLLLVSNITFIVKAIEIRPDLLQNMFWLAGLFFFLLSQKKQKNYNFIASFCWALAILTNVKIIFAILMTLVLFLLFSKNKNKYLYILRPIGIILIILGIYVFYLFFNHSLYGFLEHVIYAKAHVAGSFQNNKEIGTCFARFYTSNYLFITLFLLGLTTILRGNKAELPKVLSILTTCLFLSSFFFGYYLQWYQTFLPLMAIISAVGLEHVFIYSSKKSSAPEFLIIIVLSGYLYINLVATNYLENNILKMSKNLQQTDELSQLLAATTKNDKVLLFRKEPSAIFIFRHSLFYNWQINGYMERHMDSFPEIKQIQSANFYLKLATEQCNIINVEDNSFKYFSEKTTRYIYINYTRLRNGLWIKNTLAEKL